MGIVNIDVTSLSDVQFVATNQVASYSIGSRNFFMLRDYTFNGLGVKIWEMEANGSLVDITFEDTFADDLTAQDLTMLVGGAASVLETNSGAFAYIYGYFGQTIDDLSNSGAPLNVFSVATDGEMTRVAISNEVSGLATKEAILTIGSRDFLIQPNDANYGNNESSIKLTDLSDPLNPTEIFDTKPDTANEFTAVRSQKEIETAVIGNNGYAIIRNAVPGATADYSVFRIGAQGALKSRTEWSDTLENQHTNYLTAPVISDAFTSVTVGADVFFIAANSNSMQSFALAKNGELTAAHTILDFNQVNWTAVEAFEIDGQDYVVAAGRGIEVYAVTEDGHFAFVQFYPVTNDAGFVQQRTIDVIQEGGETFFVTTSVNNGYEARSYRFRPEDEEIEGGIFPDTLRGGDGDDWISGGRGADRLIGNAGHDAIDGGNGADFIHGGAGNDALSGGNGGDTINGAAGTDFIKGGGGNDTLNGGSDIDIMHGGTGKDVIKGGTGADIMYGEDGNDRIFGQQGSDVLYDGRGRDVLSGGSDADIFVFVKDTKLDTIVDYEDGELLNFTDYGSGLNFASITFTQIDAGTIDLEVAGDVLRIKAQTGVIQEDDFTLSDFVFV